MCPILQHTWAVVLLLRQKLPAASAIAALL
jgi:hypothetical protein